MGTRERRTVKRAHVFNVNVSRECMLRANGCPWDKVQGRVRGEGRAP